MQETIKNINIDLLIPFKNHPFKKRDGIEKEELTESIKENGLLEPIIVRSFSAGTYEIISGHRRVEVCKELGMQTVLAIVRDKNNNAPWSYGYLCYNRLNNGSAQKRRDAGLDDTGYCDQTEIPDWKLEMMGKMIMEQVWRTRAEDIKLACKILNECYKPDIKAPRQNKSVMLANIEKLKSKKDNLLDMRSDGEITKEEFLNKKEEIDKKISQLTAEYEKDDCPTESDEAGLELSKIEAALNELIDFSQPVLPREIYQKFVSKVTPYSKTHYRWYLNLDGTGTQTADVKVNGRKSNAAVAFCEEGEIPPVHFKEIIFFNILKQEIINKKSFFVATLHRLLLNKSRLSSRQRKTE